MPRPADKIFLRIAVDNGALQRQDATDVWDELLRLEAEGETVKARVLCVELGFMDQGLARKLKHQVRSALEKMVREESRDQRQVAGFELFEKLSSGAMGTVYKARHLRLNKVVALKLLNPDFVGDESYVARFLLEAQAAASLNHPNVVQAYDVGQTGNVHFLAMEFVEGKTLKDLIHRRGSLEESAAVEIVLQILDGLRHAWEHRLVHRDVKPANIMITKEGQAKLLDLGLVRRTDQVSNLTGDGRAVGTPYFMAPEQALDKGTDYRADVYGLGATLFNMVTGEKPYVAGTPVAVMNMHLKAPIPDASDINPRVSKGLSQIIIKMLAKRPADRYQDPHRLIHDLTTVLQGFMPDLQGGETPVGLDFIGPRDEDTSGSRSARGGRGSGKKGGSGSAPQRGGYGRRAREGDADSDDEPAPRNWVPIGAAAAAGILIGAVIFLTSGEKKQVVLVNDEPEVAGEDPLVAKERQAKTALAEVPAEGWPRVDALEEVAKSYADCPSGKEARSQARDLRTTLSRAEEQRYDEADRSLAELAQAGRLRAAVDGYQALAGSLRVEGLQKEAKRRADELAGLLDNRSSSAEEQAKKLEAEGHEREAAALRRRRAELFLTPAQREVETAKARELESKAESRESEQAAAQRREAEIARQREEAKVAGLPGLLAALLKEGEQDSALTLATEAAISMTQADLRERAQVHKTALEAITNLRPLALAALKEKTGTSVSFARLRGQKVTGEIESVEGDQVAIKVGRGALVSVSLTDLEEATTWDWVRRGQGRTSEPYLRGVTSLKLYRGDEDALQYLKQCQDAEVDLSALVAELRRLNTGQGADPVDQPTDPQPVATKTELTEKEKYALALKRQEEIKQIVARRKDLFREADEVGYDSVNGRLEPIYRFFQDGRNFRSEWKVTQGEATPTPPGQTERQGLRLQGREGRAEFIAPLNGSLEFKLRFLSFGNDRRARFAVVLEGEERRRVLFETGQIDYLVKRKRKARGGTNRLADFTHRADVSFEVQLQGNLLISRINTEETARIELPEGEELGTYRLALEWGNASISLLELRCLCTPDEEWLRERMK